MFVLEGSLQHYWVKYLLRLSQKEVQPKKLVLGSKSKFIRSKMNLLVRMFFPNSIQTSSK